MAIDLSIRKLPLLEWGAEHTLLSSLGDKREKMIAGITVLMNPVTFHQNQNTSSIKNANDKLVSTPQASAILT